MIVSEVAQFTGQLEKLQECDDGIAEGVLSQMARPQAVRGNRHKM